MVTLIVQHLFFSSAINPVSKPALRSRSATATLTWFGLLLFVCLSAPVRLDAATLSDPAVDAYNVRVSTETFAGLYKFTTDTLLVETAQAITNFGSDTIKFYMGHNTANQSGVTLTANITNLMTLARDEPSYRRVLDMPFRHIIMWEYPFSNPDAPFQDGNYTATEQANDYREMYDLTHYLLTNYNNSGKTFYLGHWEGDGYLSVNNWTTNPSPAVVTNMILWENNRQKAVDDAKAATSRTNVSVYYYAEANRVRDAMLNGPTNNVRLINAVVPYLTNLDYLSYSSYDAQDLSATDLYATLNYMQARLSTNKASVIPGERIWIGEYGHGGNSTDSQEPFNRAYIQRLLNWAPAGPRFILYWEMYDNEAGKNFCLIDSNNVKTASWYLHQRFHNQAQLLVAQFKEKNGRLPLDSEFAPLVTPLLNAPLPAPVALAVANVGGDLLTAASASISGTLAQGIYGDNAASVRVYWGRQDGGAVRGNWENSQLVGVNTNFNPAIFTATLTNLAPQTNYYFRFYATNSGGEAWAPASAQLSTVTLNPPDFGSRMKISFSGYNRGEALANLPVLVNLGTNLPGFTYGSFASSSGGDLRFADASGVRLIPHEIDEWNTGGVSSVWVQVPLLASTNDFIWAYWGNPAATNPPASTTNGAVWAPAHNLVWHLKEGGFPYADSTGQYPATSGVPAVSVGGFIGHGISLNGSSQYLNAGPINMGGAFTLSAWIKLSSSATNIQTIWANKIGGWNSDGFALYVDSFNTADQKLILETGDGTNGSAVASGPGAVSFGQWHRVVAVVNRTAGTGQLFVDGTNVTQSGSVTTTLGNQAAVNLGRFTDGSFRLTGTIDEARIEAGTPSANWVWAGGMTAASNSTFSAYSVVNPQPTLSATHSGNAPALTWPASAGVFTLYTTTSLTPPAWVPVSAQPVLINSQWQYTLAASGGSIQYYRLQAR